MSRHCVLNDNLLCTVSEYHEKQCDIQHINTHGQQNVALADLLATIRNLYHGMLMYLKRTSGLLLTRS